MRQAYPLIYCVSPEARAKLLVQVTSRDSIPEDNWVEWLTDKKQADLTHNLVFDEATMRSLRRPPVHPARVK